MLWNYCKKTMTFFNILVAKNLFWYDFQRNVILEDSDRPEICLGLQGNVTGNTTKVNENNGNIFIISTKISLLLAIYEYNTDILKI